MRVAVFTNCYEPVVNGIVTTIRFFRQGLLAAGHDVYLFAPACRGWRDREKNIFRFPAVNFTRRIYFPVAIPYYPGLSDLLRRLQPDIIHSHHPLVLGEVALNYAKRMDIPLAYTFHTRYENYTHYFAPLPSTMVRWAARKLVCDFAGQADLLTVPTGSIAGLLRSYGITREIKVLANPLDLGVYERPDRTGVRARYGLKDCRVLLHTGRLGREKNLALLLQAFAKITGGCRDDVRLLLVGSGPAEPELRRQVQNLGLADRVIFAGEVHYREIPHYYAGADLFVMTSTSETFGLVLVEALASGLPVVAVAASGSEDTIIPGHNGILTPEDPQVFAAEVLSLLENEPRRRRLARGARESARRYSVENLTRELLTLYEQVVRKKQEGKRGGFFEKAR